jgi:hypothetical protein
MQTLFRKTASQNTQTHLGESIFMLAPPKTLCLFKMFQKNIPPVAIT